MDQLEISGADSPTFSVRSADGTSIAVWSEGSGPPLVLVHGSFFAHQMLDPLIEHLKDRVTTYAMNRRGFDSSGDNEPYALEREFEDVAAVVDDVASRTGQPVSVLGHSFGGSCAMGGAARSDQVHRLVLYEPSLGMPAPPDCLEAMERDHAAGRPEEVLRRLFVDVMQVPEEEFVALRDGPQGAEFLSSASTALRETRAESDWVYRPGVFSAISAPILMLVGTESPPSLLKTTLLAFAELPNIRLHVLKGHAHLAYHDDPAMVADVITRFLQEAVPVQVRAEEFYSGAP